jgi:predicted double-glycine peptidase
MKKIMRDMYGLVFLMLALCTYLHAETPASIIDPTRSNTRLVGQDWKALRDKNITKQEKDFSCGGASLATLLNGYYGQSFTEVQMLSAMGNDSTQSSFTDMQRALLKIGFKGQGYATTYEQLTKLKAPVIIFLQKGNDGHFSVLRGIDANTVWLADPLMGNSTFSREQFLEIWETRKNGTINPEFKGKFLAVFPDKAEASVQTSFFNNKPTCQTTQALKLQTLRSY